jgi:hypothetical protein
MLRATTREGTWAHIACAHWLPEVTEVAMDGRKCFAGCDAAVAARGGSCAGCRFKGGAVVACAKR